MVQQPAGNWPQRAIYRRIAMKKFTLFLDKRIQEDADIRRPNLLPALNFAADLCDSIIRPRFFEQSRTDARMIDKVLCIGWAEHGWMHDAFSEAHRVESHIYPSPWNKDEVQVKVQMYKPEAKSPHFEICASSNTRTGEMGVDHITL